MQFDPENSKASFFFGVRGRIALWFILGTSTLLALGAYTVYITGLASIQGTLGQTYCQMAGRVSDQFQARLLDRYSLVRGIATDVLTAAVVAEATYIYIKRDDAWADARLARFQKEWLQGTIGEKSASLHPQLSSRLSVIAGLEQTMPHALSVYDTKGVLVAALNQPPMRVIRETNLYKIIAKRKEHFTFVKFNREPDTITIILPVWSGTSIAGYVMGEFDFAALMEGIGNIEFGRSGEAVIVDYAGVPLMGVAQKYLFDVMKQINTRAKPNTVDDTTYWVTIPASDDGGAWERLACVAPISQINMLRETIDLPPWSVVVTQSPDESYAPLQSSLKVLAYAGVVGVLFIGLVGGVAATNLTRPLHQLRDGVRRFAAGNRNQRIALNSKDEFGDLAQEFNRMADRVVVSENELNAFAQAVEDATDSILLTNTDGIIYYVNPAFEEITGYTHDEAIGKSPSILRSQKTTKETHGAMWKCIIAGKPWRGEIWNCRKNGEMYPVDLTISPIHDDAGKIVSLLGIHRDITLARDYQQELEREVDARTQEIATTKGLAAMGRMASMVAHDLRNALSTVKMNLQILSRQQEGGNEADYEHFQIALGQVHYMEEFLSDMLIYARPESLRTAPCDLGGLVEDVVAAEQLLAESNAVHVKVEEEKDLPAVMCDQLKVSAVLHNVIENAIQAMTEGGDITISISKDVFQQKDGHSGSDSRPCVRLSVCDTGVGIPEDLLSEVAEPFFTTRAKGTGLGLAITKRIIEQHGGQLSIVSSVGEGATVSFTLPAET